jgi:type I restriction enzyme M protein
MVNERKTEDLVRTHFKNFLDQIIIEEQQSENPRIKKLLATASKSGEGAGYPEFIIQLKKNAELIIVVECKAQVNRHESQNRDKPKDFAVDGALLYSSYLAKEFNVISIAVSGQSEKDLKISHFLQLKDDKKPIHAEDKYGTKLLSVDDYLDGYIKSPEKFRQDYNKLLEFSKKLNEKLHGYKVGEKYRSLLISCILIALENNSFKLTYKQADYNKPDKISRFLVDVVRNEFDKSIEELEEGKRLEQKEKYKLVIEKFGFIKLDTALSTEYSKTRPNIPVLTDIVEDIETNVQDFIKTHEYFDVLGQLYIEFLRYANSDKGLGIVLTPPHITEFMAELAEVNKDSVVYDNCTGTGGFLVSAMNLMVKDAKGDQAKISNIKLKQLLGVEYDSDIFTLACSNMFIHQDGKSNILKGSCFETKIMNMVKAVKPNVGLLNPPYKADKKKDTDEYEFILNNLECLEQGGKCVAIVPMQSALAQSGKVLEYKKKLMSQHTLEAVFSMPDELFFNSKVGVVSCIMVFTAKRPHPVNKKTYFGYYKNDGFVKRKTKGRIDLFNTWKGIKDLWITNYQNKENVAGLSVNKLVKAEDEWCAEAYMETDYVSLTKRDFESTLVNYQAFLLLSKITKDALYLPELENEYELKTENWVTYELPYLFDITGSKTTPITELEEYGYGSWPFVTTQATNNGTEGFYDYYTEEGNVLTIDSAVLGYCAYQPLNFSASDHVEKLIPKFNMNKYHALFLATVLNKEQYRYNYGRKASQTRLKDRSIKLPYNESGEPDWKFMENYIKSLPYSSSI